MRDLRSIWLAVLTVIGVVSASAVPSNAAPAYYQPTASLTALANYGANSALVANAAVTYVGNYTWVSVTCTPNSYDLVQATGVSASVGCWHSVAPTASIDARAFGAKCNGTDDDAIAVNAAITVATSASKNSVSLPPGICRAISGTFNVTGAVCLSGSGHGQTTVKTTANPGFPGVTLSGTQSCVHSLTVDGNSTVAGARNSDGILTPTGVFETKVYDVEVLHTADNGIEDRGIRTEIYSNFVHDNFTNGIYVFGITATRAQFGNIHDNMVVNNSSGGTTWDGIDLDPCHDHYHVHDNIVIGNDIIFGGAFSVPTTACGASTFDQILNNTIIGSSENGLAFLGQQNDTLVQGNTVTTPTGWCIYGNNNGFTAFRIQVLNNTCIGSTKEGIYFANFNDLTTGGFTALMIAGNHIENTGSSPSLRVASGSINVQIIGNVVNPGSTGTYAIDVSQAGNVASVIVDQSNILFAGTSGTINSLSGQTIAQGIGQTCTIATGGTLVFVRGILTSGTCNH